MGQSILSSGIDTLLEVREQVNELDGLKSRQEELTIEEERLERTVSIKEKQVSEEITETVNRRREEIEATYSEQEENIRARLKKVKAKKEKYKNGKISERIEMETAGLYEENRQLKADGRQVFKQDRAPKVCNTTLYYSLFMPRGLKEVLICSGFFLLIFAAIPAGVYFCFKEPKAWYLIIIYIVDLVLFGGLYIWIHNTTKGRFGETLVKGRKIRNKIRLNYKKIRDIRRKIEKDKDESIYGLEDFDEEILELEEETKVTIQQKKEAVQAFDNTTKLIIMDEIKNRHQVELEETRQQYEEVHNELKITGDEIKEKALFIAEEYEVFLGKEFVSVTALDKLMELMEKGEAKTIGDALVRYKTEV